MKTVERLGVFGPMMVEQLLMAEAEVLVGVRMRMFSRVGGYRQRDWYRRRILLYDVVRIKGVSNSMTGVRKREQKSDRRSQIQGRFSV